MLGKLRIAFSAVCGIICLLLTLLWMRSFHRLDIFQYRISAEQVLGIGSNRGTCHASKFLSNIDPKTWALTQRKTIGAPVIAKGDEFFKLGPVLGIHHWGPNNVTVFIPHWVAVLLSATFALALWVRWRFSLLSLFIVMTVIAAVLGIFMARDWVNTEPQNTIPDLPPQQFPTGVPEFTPVNVVTEVVG